MWNLAKGFTSTKFNQSITYLQKFLAWVFCLPVNIAFFTFTFSLFVMTNTSTPSNPSHIQGQWSSIVYMYHSISTNKGGDESRSSRYVLLQVKKLCPSTWANVEERWAISYESHCRHELIMLKIGVTETLMKELYCSLNNTTLHVTMCDKLTIILAEHKEVK